MYGHYQYVTKASKCPSRITGAPRQELGYHGYEVTYPKGSGEARMSSPNMGSVCGGQDGVAFNIDDASWTQGSGLSVVYSTSKYDAAYPPLWKVLFAPSSLNKWLTQDQDS